mmetsp:Transcript_100330/g.198982  ORF Transcript_100330/g.198982 Transcript_100330/m.198982 type:complete len:220 (-) Transcript_100330:794-1453(-)
MRLHHLAIYPRCMAVARGGCVVCNYPAVSVASSLSDHREKTSVTHGGLEAPHQLHCLGAVLAPFLPRCEPVDGCGLRKQRAQDEVNRLLVQKWQPRWCQLVLVWRIACEKQDFSLMRAGKPRRVKAPRQRDLQRGPFSEVAFSSVEKLCAKACGVTILVSPYGHQITGFGELKRHFANTPTVDAAGLIAWRNRLPLQPIPGLFKQHKYILTAIVVTQIT